MLKNYLNDLEEMRGRKADFSEYYQKILNGINDLKGNDKPIFIYAVLNDIRQLGVSEGERIANKAMCDFLSNRVTS